MNKINRKFIEKRLRKIDPGLENSLSALVLLAAIHVGPNIKRIARLLQEPRKSVSIYTTRYRENGIFSYNKVHGNYLDEENGYVEFIMDTLVGDGLLVKQ